MAIELLGAVAPIHMIGESHSLVFSNLLFRPEGGGETYLCRTKFFPVLTAANYSTDGQVSAEFVQGLIGEDIFDKTLRPSFMTAEKSAAFLIGMPVMAPPMVLFAGDLDMNQLFRQLGDTYDIILPDDPGYGVDKSRQILAYADAHGHIAGFLEPFFAAVRQLQAVQFSRIMVHCLPPRSPDEAAAARWTGDAVVAAAVRAKLTVLANRLIAAFCAETGIPFIETWAELTENGYLRPEFELDGFHLNRQAALVSLERITAELLDRTATVWNATRYQHALHQAAPRAPRDQAADHDPRWAETGLVRGQIDVPSDTAGLSFDIVGANPHARPDWTGRPRAGCPGLALAEPAQDLLDEAAAILGAGSPLALLEAGSDRELTVTSFRPVQYEAAGAGIEPLPAPAGARRALIFLSDGDRISFVGSDGQAIPGEPISRGTLLVYDPARISPRLAAGTQDLDVIELALIPRLSGQPFRVVWAGLCDWPADPYAYGVAGMKAAPQFSGPVVKERSHW